MVAHPDDEVLGVGGTLVAHADAGDEVRVLIATEDRPGAAIDVLAAAREIGIAEVRRLGWPVISLARMDERALNAPIEAAIRTFDPNTVYTHHTGDLNSDHRALAHAVLVACRPVNLGAPSRLLAFDTPSSTEWATGMATPGGFAPNVFVDVTRTLDRKLAAMATAYGAELRVAPHPRNLDSLRARAAYWGQWAGCQYAEPFVLVREVVREAEVAA